MQNVIYRHNEVPRKSFESKQRDYHGSWTTTDSVLSADGSECTAGNTGTTHERELLGPLVAFYVVNRASLKTAFKYTQILK